jgi:hypothetical protein
VCATAMEAVVQLNGIEPAIPDALEHLPDRPQVPVVGPCAE